jgi:predicted transcriptional regulator
MGKPEPEFEQGGVEEEADIFDFEDEAAIDAADAEAEADIAAGRVVSNAAVMRWLKSLMTDNPLPRPQPGE